MYNANAELVPIEIGKKKPGQYELDTTPAEDAMAVVYVCTHSVVVDPSGLDSSRLLCVIVRTNLYHVDICPHQNTAMETSFTETKTAPYLLHDRS